MEKQESKWDFLRSYVSICLERNSELTSAELARKAAVAFDLTVDPETLRKQISKMRLDQEGRSWIVDNLQKKSIEVIEAIKPASTHFSHQLPGTYLVLGCMHVPFHNKNMTSAVLSLMEEKDFSGLILNGDFLDCNTLSSHDKGKFTAVPGLTLTKEYEEGNIVMDKLLERLPKDALKVYMYGNHEDRYGRFIADMQNAKTPPKSPKEGLNLDERGFLTMDDYSSNYFTLGKHLDVIHGIFYNDHSAKKHIDRFRGSVLFAHTHRIQSYIEGNTGGFNIGWGGDKEAPAFRYADRATKASWQNGFAVVTIDKEGDYYVEQVICVNGRFVYGGNPY